jgi:ADP-heptose:LPS heptosyltransferase
MNFYIHTGGGIGDMIKHYFWGHYGWKYLKSIKVKYPESKIKLITTCSNPIGSNIFKFNPYIDEREIYPWQDPNHIWPDLKNKTKDYSNLAKANGILDLTAQSPGVVHLGDADKKDLIKFQPKKNYIVIHPFAGDNTRMPMPLKEYFALAKQYVNKLGCKVVIIGGNSQRVIGKTDRILKEAFPFNGEGIVNLVNKISIRTAIRLTQESSCFLGTNSALFCVRLSLNKPAIIFFNGAVVQKKPIWKLSKTSDIYYMATKKGKCVLPEQATKTVKDALHASE